MSRRKQSSSSRRRASSRERATRPRTHEAPPLEPGQRTNTPGFTLRSYEVGALPLINHLLGRMRLEELLRQYLPPDDPRCELPTSHVLLVLLRNVLVSREPVYAVAEWAARYAPDLFDLWIDDVSLLQDDRLGRCLARLFAGAGPELILAVVRHVIDEFQVSLDELHNDSTTVSFSGGYADAAEEGHRAGRVTPAITWGHSKDHRPDLKQLLFTLTVTQDGHVPVYFTSSGGNVADDQTHCATWDLLCQLVGRVDFLYVADCKLASEENLGHIARPGGRFITVMPRTHREDKTFRARLCQSPKAIPWKELYDVKDDHGQVIDTLSVCSEEQLSAAGYRLLWYRSTRKVEYDRQARSQRTQRAFAALEALRARLEGPRTRFREREKVQQAVDEILTHCEVETFVRVQLEECEQATYRQATPGRPSPQTKYRKETRHHYSLTWSVDPLLLAQVERQDGVFPLLTNDRHLSAEEVLRAYKRQPMIEKRFSQFKTDFAVAPVYLKDVARIQGLLAVYFFVLLVQTLLERELRRAMAQQGLESLPLYPEGRPCRHPTTHRVLEIFELVQRHVFHKPGSEEPEVFVTELTPLQRQILKLLGLSPRNYGY
jgi:transposase